MGSLYYIDEEKCEGRGVQRLGDVLRNGVDKGVDCLLYTYLGRYPVTASKLSVYPG